MSLLDDAHAYAAMANAVNPYGDGLAAARTVAALADFFGVGPRMPDFTPLEGGVPLRRAPVPAA
jgi:UDP-N-acetylglucosamine 2-epimerase (non-hydrolysing)